jgi:hypothetical protein
MGNDGDGDGVPDMVDNCPTVSNASQQDGDSDGVGNDCDNCPTVPNPGQADADLDGLGDACDLDPCEEPSALDLRPGAVPLRVEKAPAGLVHVTWEATSSGSYALHGGPLAQMPGSRPAPSQSECALAAPEAVVDFGAGSTYFLAVARCGASESSYGRDSRGAERRVASPPCP